MGWGGGEREEGAEEDGDVWVGRGERNGWGGGSVMRRWDRTRRASCRRSQLEVRVGAGVACGVPAGFIFTIDCTLRASARHLA